VKTIVDKRRNKKTQAKTMGEIIEITDDR